MDGNALMVERVAKAISMALVGDDRYFPDYDTLARAAITAMREPTETMLHAGCAKAAEEQARPVGINRTDAGDIFQAMIDAALEEQAPSATPIPEVAAPRLQSKVDARS